MKDTTQTTATSAVKPIKIDLLSVVEDMFLVLTPKEKEVIVKRFRLDNQPRQTLEKIGQAFSVTRERIRQIEKIALGKLRRTATNSRLSEINALALEILRKKGGVLLENKLVAEVLNSIASSQSVDAYIVQLALNINPELRKNDKTNVFYTFWRLQSVPLSTIKDIIARGIKILEKNKDVVSMQDVSKAIHTELNDKEISQELIVSALGVDKRIKETKEGEFGLMSWRHVNPRSIRDKAYIILKKQTAPLHFVDIANMIAEAAFDKKVVTTQAVHNELIRYDQFVLVGRGLYALKEWGYKKGTVSDVIEDLLAKKNPLTKQEIIEGVLKQRRVKKGTISLNLQKNPRFVRVGRAVYQLDITKTK